MAPPTFFLTAAAAEEGAEESSFVAGVDLAAVFEGVVGVGVEEMEDMVCSRGKGVSWFRGKKERDECVH